MSAQAIPIHEAPAGQAPDRNLPQALLRSDVEEIRVDLQAVPAALHAVATADAAELGHRQVHPEGRGRGRPTSERRHDGAGASHQGT